jgi:glycosyltransferase involved in cell wall biosynthesis
MNVLLVSTSDLEGGAARATNRLLQGLRQNHVPVQMLVQEKRGGDPAVVGLPATSGIHKASVGLRLTLDQLPLKRYPQREPGAFSPQWLPDRTVALINQLNPDVVNLHWVNNGYIQIESLAALSKPIVWTLHDMWAFTGGCHYNQECDRYTQSCGNCPQLASSRQSDLSQRIWRRKHQAWKKLNLTIVTPSQWLADCARKSSLFKDCRVECIPNGIDTSVYRPIDRHLARDILKLPQDKYLLLSGSLGGIADKRKGFHLLQPALKELSQSAWGSQIELVVFGQSEPSNPPDLGLKTHYVGNFGDDYSLALLYSAADVFVAPSVQDNLPNTVMESLACGTICIAFGIGGLSDMIEHQYNGYLAKAFDVKDLVNGIIWLLADRERAKELSENARTKAIAEFSLNVLADHYHQLFTEVLTRVNHP